VFETTELATMDEQVGDHMKLELLSNHFLKMFSYCVKKNDWLERDLEVLYNILFSLGIMTVINVLKWYSQ